MVDPEAPAITSCQVEHGRYVDEAHAVGDERFSTRLPFPVDVAPSELLDQEAD